MYIYKKCKICFYFILCKFFFLINIFFIKFKEKTYKKKIYK